MKSSFYNYSVLTVALAAAMGLTSTAYAATSKADSTPTIDNVATATYSISGIAQTAVQSNKVTVNITQSAAFSLEAKNVDDSASDDFNKNLVVTPNGRVTFEHTLSNSGNIKDSYTLNLIQGGTIAGIVQSASSYDLDKTSVTYTIYAADKSVKSLKTVTGTVFQNTVIELLPGETVGISIAAKAKDNVGGYSQNLTLEASSTFFASDTTKAKLININNSITKVPVFQITSKVSNTLNLNDPGSKATYTITVRNDDRASYAADAKNIVVIDGLPEGLRLADNPNISMVNGAGASIEAGKLGDGKSGADDSIKVTLLNLAVNETVTITFDVQKDANETLANPKEIINHAFVTLDLTEGEIIYDSTNPADSKQNTSRFYPSTDDSELLTGVVNTAIGGDSAAPLVANQRGLEISSPTLKEIPTSTSTGTQVTHSAVITNNGRETEGKNPGDIKFTIGSGTDNKVTVVTGSVELVYDPDNNPSTPNYTYTISRVDGVNDLSTAVAKDGAPVWTGMAPGSTVTINYKVESNNAVIDTAEKTTITMIVGGTDAPTAGTRVVQNTTEVKGLKLVKEQAVNETCSATAILSFSKDETAAKPGDCIVYKITAFNDFSGTDPRFSFDNLVISDTIARFSNKATVLSGTTIPAFDIKLDNVPNADATTAPVGKTYLASVDTTEVSGTVTTLAPQKYAALMFAVKINEKGTVTP